MSKRGWFEVDPEGLRELFGAMPLGRLMTELIANAFDEKVSLCSVKIESDERFGRRVTRVLVTDDCADGFRNIADAYTFFGSSIKRLNPEQRGRFMSGEKKVVVQSLWARVSSTTGEIIFDEKNGRHKTRNKREAGSEIELIFPRWSAKELAQVEAVLRQLIPPLGVLFTLNGIQVPSRVPLKIKEATLVTEVLRTLDSGVTAMTRTERKTSIEFYTKAAEGAFLYEMGIPVCELSGAYDVSVCQKIPLSQDRDTVPESFLRRIYAEELLAFGAELDVEALGRENVQSAMTDKHVDPITAKIIFHLVHGDNAVIQSNSPDADQKAVREGLTLVSSQSFGREVNDKLREAGVQTSYDIFGPTSFETAEILDTREYTPAQRNFVDYATMLTGKLLPNLTLSIELGRWTHARASAFNQAKTTLIFHIDRVDIQHPVTGAHTLILHEAAHTEGTEHDGVYDKAFERLVGKATTLLAAHPELFRPFEPGAFPSPKGSE